MKPLLICLFALALLKGAAQSYSLSPGTKLQPGRNDSLVSAMKKYIREKGLSSGTIKLSQDNMPCIITNTSLLTPMPNAWKTDVADLETRPAAIPNPARPRQWKAVPIKQ